MPKSLHIHAAMPISGVAGFRAGYGDKLRCVIDATDPGAVPGGSTTKGAKAPVMTGPNQDRRVLKSIVFARAE